MCSRSSPGRPASPHVSIILDDVFGVWLDDVRQNTSLGCEVEVTSETPWYIAPSAIAITHRAIRLAVEAVTMLTGIFHDRQEVVDGFLVLRGKDGSPVGERGRGGARHHYNRRSRYWVILVTGN